jgi:hypothetical protein
MKELRVKEVMSKASQERLIDFLFNSSTHPFFFTAPLSTSVVLSYIYFLPQFNLRQKVILRNKEHW